MSIRNHVRKLRPVRESYTPPEDKLQYFFERVDTILMLSITDDNFCSPIAFKVKNSNHLQLKIVQKFTLYT